MSTSISVVARISLSDDDVEAIRTYNNLCELEIEIPEKLVDIIQNVLRTKWDVGEKLPTENTLVEVHLEGKGDAMYDDGMIVPMHEIPKGTVALRIYAE